MSLKNELEAILVNPDPLNGEVITLTDSWDTFLEESKGLRALAVERAGWVRHDVNGKVIQSPLDTPERYKERWWPKDGDICANFRTAREPEFPGTKYKSVSVYQRTGTSLRNTIRFGRTAETNYVIGYWYDLGIRRMEFDVAGAPKRDLIVERYTKEGHVVKWTRLNEPDMYRMTVTLDSRPPLRKRGRHGA
jgi:hypothetical protein